MLCRHSPLFTPSLLLKHFHSLRKKEQKLLFLFFFFPANNFFDYHTHRSEVCLFGALTKRRPPSTTSSSISRTTSGTWSTYASGQFRSKKTSKKALKRRENRKFEPIVFRSTSFSFVGAKKRIHGVGFCHFCHSPRCRRVLWRSSSSPYL